MPKLLSVLLATALALVVSEARAQDEGAAPPPSDAPAPAPTDQPAPEAAPETAPEAAPETAPETAPEAAPEAAPEPAPEPPPEPEAAPSTQPAPPSDAEAAAGEPTEAEPAATAEPAAAAASTEPSVFERQLVAYVSTGVAAVALGTGVTVGVLAFNEYNCLADVLVCNEQRVDRGEEPILGSDFLDKKAQVDTLALAADMAYVVAAAATIVAIQGYIRGFWLTGEEEAPAGEVTQ